MERAFRRCRWESVQLTINDNDRKMHLFHLIFIHCFISAVLGFHFALHAFLFKASVAEEKRARAVIEVSERRSRNKMISGALA